MLIRYLLPLFAWVGVILLLTIRPYSVASWCMGGITYYSLIQCLLFLGYAHIVMGVLKKQLKYEGLRAKALAISIVSGVVLSVAIEITRYELDFSCYFNTWNLIFNIIGVFLGIATFRLVYRSCC